MSSMSKTEPPAGIREFSVQRFRHNAMCSELDDIAIEQPLEIRIIANPSGKPQEHAISITMRTPGQDAKLAVS